MNTPEGILVTPAGDYALLDFGAGRVLERLGPYVVDRPHPAATGNPADTPWRADWTFTGSVTSGRWRPRTPGLPREWGVQVGNRALHCVLGAGGRTGVRAEQAACWEWITTRLRNAAHVRNPIVLNLFAGSGGATAAALGAGAQVVNVACDEARLNLARRNVGDPPGVTWVLADIPTFVQTALHRRERYHLILLDPPHFHRGPENHVWDIQRDLTRLFPHLASLLDPEARGLWVSLHTQDWTLDSVAQLLGQVFPGRPIARGPLGMATPEGRILHTAAAVRWAEDRNATDATASLSPEQVEERIDVHLDPVLSSRRTAAEPARRISTLDRARQEFAIRWIGITAHTNAELAYQFASHAANALERMDAQSVETWLLNAVDIYDTSGLHAGIDALRGVEAYARQAAERVAAVTLDEVIGVLDPFVRGLSGRALRLQADPETYTDTDTVFLPARLSQLPDRDGNYQLYKALAVHQWAQTWYGTWREDLTARSASYDDPDKAVRWFHALETVRLDACLARDLPGLHRQVQALRKSAGAPLSPPELAAATARLQAPGATVQDSYALLPQFYPAPVPTPACDQGRMFPERVEAAKTARLARDRDTLRTALARLADEQRRQRAQAADASPETRDDHEPTGFRAVREIDSTAPDGFTLQLELDGRPLAPPDDVKGTMSSILQDLGDLPDDYLVPAGDGAYAWRAGQPTEERDPRDVWKGMYHEEGASLYNEWDYERQHYRKNWAVLRELDVHPQHDDFVARTLGRHRGLVQQLRKTFETLRGEDKLLKKQPYGDDVDIDALVEAYADTRSGLEMSDRLFTKLHKLERNIAVMFMVDMSGSTKGWINDAERESLLLLCEALEALGDRYAIYGFSGMTRKRCELYRIKRFDERYGAEVQGRISGIKPQDYTRMGVVIRHLTHLLQQIDARTKLLITLSDGKPDDLDGYRGEYGIEDTRMALIEAKRQGIHPYCITIDTEAREYLPHMYGAVNYTVIDEVRKLPTKVSDIYRKLTT